MNTENITPTAPSTIVPLREVAVRLHPQDNVAIAKINLQVGTTLALGPDPHPPTLVPVRQPIPGGHKMALREIAAGEPVRRYGQVIGFASQNILPGWPAIPTSVGPSSRSAPTRPPTSV